MEERGLWITFSWHFVAICPALGIDSTDLWFTSSGSFQSILGKLQKISFLPFCTQLSPAIADNPSQNLSNSCQRRAFPYIVYKRSLLSEKIQGSCSRTPKQPPQSSLSIWIETCCDVFGTQLCPPITLFMLFDIISDLGCWNLKEMGRLTRQLVSTHHCVEKPADVRDIRLHSILALPYSPQHNTASLGNFDFCSLMFLLW